MACRNEQCRCRNWCEVKSDDTYDPEKCVQAMAISTWWELLKTSGLRDKNRDEDFDENDLEED